MHALLFALLLALNAPGAGKGGESKAGQEQQLPDQNVAFIVPEGWFVFTDSIKKPGLIAAFGNESRTKLVLIFRDDINLATAPVDDKFEQEYEQGLEKGGMGKRQWGRFAHIGGHPGYERLGRARIEGKETSILNQVFIAGGKHYSLQGMLVEGEDASQDREIHDALASFRFLTPPVASRSASRSVSGPGSAAYRAGYIMGGVGGTLGMIALVIFGIRKAVEHGGRGSRRRSRGRSTGYPMPPARPSPSRPPPIPGAPPPAKILPRGGVKPRHAPVRPSPPPPPSLPS